MKLEIVPNRSSHPNPFARSRSRRLSGRFAKEAQHTGGDSLFSPGRKECRWIDGDPATNFQMCGAPVKGHSSYCKDHHKVVFRKTKGLPHVD